MFPDKLPGEDFINSWYPILIALVLGLLFGLRNYMKGKECQSRERMDKKTVIVTGANTGIGEQIAKDLLERGATVILTCRDLEKGKKAAEFLEKSTKSNKLRLMQLDLASFKSVREFAKTFLEKEEKLDVLINNAGLVCYPEKELTEDGHELHFQVNYLSTFLLTHLLLDKLKSSSPSRIVNTSALAYQLAVPDFNDIKFEKEEYKGGAAYALSKLALMLFTKQLAKELEGTNVTVNIVNPGVVNTDAYRHMPFMKSTFIYMAFAPFLWFFMKRAKDGAQSAIQCAVAKEEEGVSGKYYVECAIKEPNEHAQNEEAAKELYSASMYWTGLKTGKPVIREEEEEGATKEENADTKQEVEEEES